MGCVFTSRTFPYNNGDKDLLRDSVMQRCDQDAYEDGRIYSGKWSSSYGGLEFTDKTFESVEKAESWLEENADKGGNLIAVKAKYVVAPSTAEDPKFKELMAQLEEACQAHWKEPIRIVKAARVSKTPFKSCKGCGSRIRLQYVDTVNCPVCKKDLLTTEKHKRIAKRLVAQEEKMRTRVQERQRVLFERQRKQGIVKDDILWVVGANCPS